MICKNDNVHTVFIVSVMRDILRDLSADPFSKLLCLRFVKDVFCYCGSYGFGTLVNSLLTK